MICDPCERQLTKPGRHRRHKRCEDEVVRGSCAGPCWCPACHPMPRNYDPPPMSLNDAMIKPAPTPRVDFALSA